MTPRHQRKRSAFAERGQPRRECRDGHRNRRNSLPVLLAAFRSRPDRMIADSGDRPIIGITTDLSLRPVGGAGQPAERRIAQLDMAYVDSILAAGAVPLLIAPMPAPALARAAAALDGLILTGGDGLPASLTEDLGSLPSDLAPVLPERFDAELAVYRAVRARSVPVLGVCLGMQLMNLEAGGTLSMDVARDTAGAMGHSLKRGRDRHGLDLLAGSAIERWWRDANSTMRPEVNSSHLQAVRTPGAGLMAVAWADDGVVEALEPVAGLERDWRLGVQWHPEREAGALGVDLVRRLVEASRVHSRRTHCDPRTEEDHQ